MTREFDRFRFSFFEDRDSARNGLDVAALSALTGHERETSEAMLFDFLPDTRAVIGLGVLRSRRAEAALIKLLKESLAREPSGARIELAKALQLIRPDRYWIDVLSDVLSSAPSWPLRMDAALALRIAPDEAAVRALITALDDPESLVRHHAAASLLALHAVPSGPDGPEHMTFRIMAGEAGRRDAAKAEILAAIAGRPLAS